MTHVYRASVPSILLDLGVPDAEVEDHGLWAAFKSVMRQHYCAGKKNATLITALSGFRAKLGAYRIWRSEIKVPDELLNMICPEIKLSPQKDDKQKPITPTTFIELINYLKRVLLQDAPALKQINPNHFIFNHSVILAVIFRSLKLKSINNLNRNAWDPNTTIKRIGKNAALQKKKI